MPETQTKHLGTAKSPLVPVVMEPRPAVAAYDGSEDLETVFDVAVVGLGAMGSSALYHAAKAGLSVIGFERQGHVGHSQGSSHGESRIIRKAYFEHPSYVPLLQDSYARWHELEAQTGRTLLHYTGGLDIGRPTSDIVIGAKKSCNEHSLQHQVLSPEQVAARWPGITLPAGYEAVYQPDAGVLEPEKCIEAYYLLAQMLGAKARLRCVIKDITLSACGTYVEVVTDTQGTFKAKKVVVSAGPWAAQTMRGTSLWKEAQFTTPSTTSTNTDATTETATEAAAGTEGDAASPVRLPLSLQAAVDSLVVERQVVSWYRPQDKALYSMAAGGKDNNKDVGIGADGTRPGFPIFLAHLTEEEGAAGADAGAGAGAHCQYYYGFPVFGAEDGFKLARYNHRREAVEDAARVARAVDAADLETQVPVIATLFPGLACAADGSNAVKEGEFAAPKEAPAPAKPAASVDVDADAPEEEEAAPVREHHGTYGPIPGAPASCANHIKSVTCMFTNTRDGNFVIDAVPLARSGAAPLASTLAQGVAAAEAAVAGAGAGDGNAEEAEFALADATLAATAASALPGLVFVSACAGHGFKFASAIGAAVADIAAGTPRADLAWLGLSRYEDKVEGDAK